jgi:hypothetical protein
LEVTQSYLFHKGIFNVNDGSFVDIVNTQVMKCMVCYKEVISLPILKFNIPQVEKDDNLLQWHPTMGKLVDDKHYN